MSPQQAALLALVSPADRDDRVRERRAFIRVDPVELADPLVARVKYGETLTLVDVSAGGALFETTIPLRPDSSLVLEVMGAGAQDALPLVSRIVRCQVASVRGGIRYRGACAFKRPLDHPGLAVAPAPLMPTPPENFLRPEFALKTIVEGYRRASASKASGRWRDTSALLEALDKLRDAAERRADPTDRRLGQLVGAVVPVLHRNESPEVVMGEVMDQLRKHVPILALRAGGAPRATSTTAQELITLNVWSEPVPSAMITAEFPAGFDLDASQFRLLKAGAYLMGLAERWTPNAPDAQPAPPAEAPPASRDEETDLPAGWHRLVVRFVDGKLLRGYSNDFHPDRAHLHLSPEVACAAGERLHVPIARLKAVFFVRDLKGDSEHVDSNEFDHMPRARKVEVTFRDGEVIVGSTMNYKPQGQGFLLAPASSRGNNRRVYVVLAAVRHIRFI